jgi:uncharacterized damage-inducible protein DinB
MKTIPMIGLALLLICCAEKKAPPTLRSTLLEQLKNTHNNKDWFVPINVAVDGLTPEQANWKDSTGNHSVAQLVSHLSFWNARVLMAFQGNKPPDFSGENDKTFKTLDAKDWDNAVKKLDSIETVWENSVENATDKQIVDWSSSLANISSHNAYHTGQIIYIRKRNGWWDDTKGVK